jgi:sugar phosphate isomerase/epimerase
MKLAFSSSVYSGLSLAEMICKAQQHGFQGIELAAGTGLAHLHAEPELSTKPESSLAQFQQARIELVGLGIAAAFDTGAPGEAARNRTDVIEHIVLAARLGCPFVRVYAGGLADRSDGSPRLERRDVILARIGARLRELVAVALQHRVTLLVENSGQFCDSLSLWHLVEAAGSPLVKGCWNPLAARLAGERPTTAIPRLASKIALVRICDARVDPTYPHPRGVSLGEGQVEIPRMIQLLKGIGYQGYLVVDRPPDDGAPSLEPDAFLSAAAAYLRKCLDENPVVLSAYKGDKFRPRQGCDFTTGR